MTLKDTILPIQLGEKIIKLIGKSFVRKIPNVQFDRRWTPILFVPASVFVSVAFVILLFRLAFVVGL